MQKLYFKNRTWGHLLLVVLQLGFISCAGKAPQGPSQAQEVTPNPEQSKSSPTSVTANNPLDSLLNSRSLPWPEIQAAKSESRTDSQSVSKTSSNEGQTRYRIQLAALTDMGEAQKRKTELEKKLGSAVNMDFEAPYYKLRTGRFSTRREAEEFRLELNGQGLDEVLVIKE